MQKLAIREELARSNSPREAVHSAGSEGAPSAVELVASSVHHAVEASDMRVRRCIIIGHGTTLSTKSADPSVARHEIVSCAERRANTVWSRSQLGLRNTDEKDPRMQSFVSSWDPRVEIPTLREYGRLVRARGSGSAAFTVDKYRGTNGIGYLIRAKDTQQDTLATPPSKQMLAAVHIPRPPSMFSPLRSAWNTMFT